MVLYSLKNQSQCWNSSTVLGPNLNVQRKAKSGKPLSCCSLPSGPRSFSLKPCSRNKWRIPVLPPLSRTATGKGQSSGHNVLGRVAGRLGMATELCSITWCGATGSLLDRQGGVTRYSGQHARCILPHGLWGVKTSQGMLGFPSWGARKIVHIIFCRLQAKSYSFYLQKLLQAIDLIKTTHMGKRKQEFGLVTTLKF